MSSASHAGCEVQTSMVHSRVWARLGTSVQKNGQNQTTWSLVRATEPGINHISETESVLRKYMIKMYTELFDIEINHWEQ